MKPASGLFALALLAFSVPAARADNRSMLAAACESCHGTDGHSAGTAMPNLAGQSKEYFVSAMKRYRSNSLPATIMGRLARGYSDAEVAAMGAWFAGKKPVAQDGPLDAALVRRGAKVFFEHCNTCHLDGRLWNQFHQYRAYEKDCSASCHLNYGPEQGAELPLIGGQWPRYLELQLQAFREGRREMSERKRKALKDLTPADLKAVSEFYASQKELER